MFGDQLAVLEFMRKFECPLADKPVMPPEAVRELCRNLIREEFSEFEEACLTGNLVEAADALADLQYVVNYAASAFGLDLEALTREVHRSNMSKVWADGSARKRPDGKILKPPTYSPADIPSVLKLLSAEVPHGRD